MPAMGISARKSRGAQDPTDLFGQGGTQNGQSLFRSDPLALKPWPSEWTRTVTYDNGSENVMHSAVNKSVGTVSYFCQPYHSWEKGTVENTIGIIRRLWPKKTDFATLTTADVNLMETWLNNRPRKCLGFRTPIEACLDECCT